MKRWTPEEAMADALKKHPECGYADWQIGLTFLMGPDGPMAATTTVVELWRNEECWMNNDPPRHTVEGYLK